MSSPKNNLTVKCVVSIYTSAAVSRSQHLILWLSDPIVKCWFDPISNPSASFCLGILLLHRLKRLASYKILTTERVFLHDKLYSKGIQKKWVLHLVTLFWTKLRACVKTSGKFILMYRPTDARRRECDNWYQICTVGLQSGNLLKRLSTAN